MIRLSKDLFRDYTILDRGIISPNNKGDAIPIFVTKPSIKRALAIMNTLLWQFEAKSWKFKKSKDNPMCLEVTISEEDIEFSLKETTKRIEHVLTKSELAKQKRGEHIWHDKYDFLPTGNITMSIDGWLPYGSKKHFKDGKTLQVEDQLEYFISQLEYSAQYKKEQRLKREKEEQLRKLENERRYQLKTLRENELKKRDLLYQDAENWQKADLIRQYIQNSKSKDLDWVKWAENCADLLDPTTEGHNTVIEETKGLNLDDRYF